MVLISLRGFFDYRELSVVTYHSHIAFIHHIGNLSGVMTILVLDDSSDRCGWTVGFSEAPFSCNRRSLSSSSFHSSFTYFDVPVLSEFLHFAAVKSSIVNAHPVKLDEVLICLLLLALLMKSPGLGDYE